MFKYAYTAINGAESACNIYIMHAGKVKYIGFEDINEGMSVTNSSEQLATSIVRQYEWEPDNCLFFEWYTDMDEDTMGTVDEITYEWDDDLTASNPKWKFFCPIHENPFE